MQIEGVVHMRLEHVLDSEYAPNTVGYFIWVPNTETAHYLRTTNAIELVVIPSFYSTINYIHMLCK